MGRRGKGGTGLGNGKIYTLAYADDMVLVVEEERGMKLMMRTFEEYMREKDLTVLVCSVLSYGVEIWGWKVRKSVEGLQERFLR